MYDLQHEINGRYSSRVDLEKRAAAQDDDFGIGRVLAALTPLTIKLLPHLFLGFAHFASNKDRAFKGHCMT